MYAQAGDQERTVASISSLLAFASSKAPDVPSTTAFAEPRCTLVLVSSLGIMNEHVSEAQCVLPASLPAAPLARKPPVPLLLLPARVSGDIGGSSRALLAAKRALAACWARMRCGAHPASHTKPTAPNMKNTYGQLKFLMMTGASSKDMMVPVCSKGAELLVGSEYR